jgi:hypothetical protein
MVEVDRVAPQGAKIATRGITTATAFARQDMQVSHGSTELPDPDLALGCRQDVYRAAFYPEMRAIYEVRVDGALLAVVKQRIAAP